MPSCYRCLTPPPAIPYARPPPERRARLVLLPLSCGRHQARQAFDESDAHLRARLLRRVPVRGHRDRPPGALRCPSSAIGTNQQAIAAEPRIGEGAAWRAGRSHRLLDISRRSSTSTVPRREARTLRCLTRLFFSSTQREVVPTIAARHASRPARVGVGGAAARRTSYIDCPRSWRRRWWRWCS